jgi:uncharacterized membrane protein
MKILKVLGFILYLVVGAAIFITAPYGIGSIFKHSNESMVLIWGIGFIMILVGITAIVAIAVFGFFAWRHYNETFWKEKDEDKE